MKGGTDGIEYFSSVYTQLILMGKAPAEAEQMVEALSAELATAVRTKILTNKPANLDRFDLMAAINAWHDNMVTEGRLTL